MKDYEIEIDNSMYKVLGAIKDARDKDAVSLARIAEIDPEEFRAFLVEYGETENEEAIELLRAAESVKHQSMAEGISQNRESVWSRLKFFLVGGGIGAVLALLFAPKAGSELRSDIADATHAGIDKSREAAQQHGTRRHEYYEATRERASELHSQAAREAAAIDAGKRAYLEEKRKTELSGKTEAAPPSPASGLER